MTNTDHSVRSLFESEAKDGANSGLYSGLKGLGLGFDSAGAATTKGFDADAKGFDHEAKGFGSGVKGFDNAAKGFDTGGLARYHNPGLDATSYDLGKIEYGEVTKRTEASPGFSASSIDHRDSNADLPKREDLDSFKVSGEARPSPSSSSSRTFSQPDRKPDNHPDNKADNAVASSSDQKEKEVSAKEESVNTEEGKYL